MHHVYKTVELTESSPESIEDAVNHAISKASQTIGNLRWFQFTETRGMIDHQKMAYWQITLKVVFTLDE